MTKKWPTSYNKSREDQINFVNEVFFGKQQAAYQLRTQHPEERSFFGKQQRLRNQEPRDGFTSRTLCGKNTPKHSRDWAKPVSTKTEEKCVPPISTQRKVEGGQDGLMSQGTCQTLPLVSPCFSFGFPGFLRCVAQNPRILLN